MSFENLNLSDLEQKLGGRFKLVTLFQKRIRELQRGLPPLIETTARDYEEIVADEIRQGKLWLAMGAEADALRLDRSEELKQIDQQRRAAEAAAAQAAAAAAQAVEAAAAAVVAPPPLATAP
jgi:DNA-directed RNA polymerase subunit K/omega